MEAQLLRTIKDKSDSIRTTNLARVKAKGDTEHINVKNTNNMDDTGRGWW